MNDLYSITYLEIRNFVNNLAQANNCLNDRLYAKANIAESRQYIQSTEQQFD